MLKDPNIDLLSELMRRRNQKELEFIIARQSVDAFTASLLIKAAAANEAGNGRTPLPVPTELVNALDGIPQRRD